MAKIGRDKAHLAAIELLAMDLDGVLTDGSIIINADGSESKKFSLLDGHGIRMWHRATLQTAVISGRETSATKVRTEQLQIGYVFQNCHQKLDAFEKLVEQSGISAEKIAYMGDDLLDLPILRRVGFAVAVADAVDEVKEQADYITRRKGGCGAVREVVEYLLKQSGRWAELMERYLV
ncbi:MAG: HAD hydrolase family protein [Planctomycetota bacterium]